MAIAPFECGLPTPEEELRRMKRAFLASLNHEIRTPLTGILGMTDLLLESQLTPPQVEYVQTTRQCAEDLLAQLNAALQFSELATGSFALDESEFNLAEMLESVARQFQPKAEAKGLQFSTTLHPSIPASAFGDAVRLRDIIGHLLGNAVKFTESGKIELEASAGPSTSNRARLVIVVRDTGVGIAQDKVQAMFESFHQEDDGLSRRFPGLGLGLALVERLLHLMHGEINIQSKLGAGSTITITVPLRLNEEADPAAAAHPKPPARQRRVLVVEDNPVSRRVIAHMLSRREYDVETVPTGEEALAEAKRRHYEAVLMDLQMPGMDGFETARRLRAMTGYAQVPIIALTAHAGEEYRLAAMAHGLEGFIEKPIDSDKLLTTLERVLV